MMNKYLFINTTVIYSAARTPEEPPRAKAARRGLASAGDAIMVLIYSCAIVLQIIRP